MDLQPGRYRHFKGGEYALIGVAHHSETMEELGSQIADVDQQNKDELVNRGMTLIEYDNAFFEEVLAVQGVQDLYTEIDTATNGLATTLQEELAAAAGA